MSGKGRKTSGNLRDALAVAKIIRSQSYWESPEAKITAVKRDELKNIARRAKPDIAEFALHYLLKRTAFAIEDLFAMREKKRQNRVQEKLEKLREAAAIFLREWGEKQSDHQLLRVVGMHFQGRLGLQAGQQPAKTSEQAEKVVEAIMRRSHQMKQIEAVLDDYLPQLLTELGSMIAPLQKTRRHKNPMEYFCAYTIANAWMVNIGEIPTLSRNTDAVSGPQQCDFQSYIASAVPSGLIGPIVPDSQA
jgi:hypothetical protein